MTRSPAPPTLPSVNLLSEPAFARLAARRLRRWFVAGGLAVLLVVGLAWGAQHLRVRDAEDALAVERAETDRLTVQTQRLAPVRTFVNGIAAQQAMAALAMAGDVHLSEVLEGIRDAAPDGAELTTIAVTVAPPVATDPAGEGTAPNPAADASVNACPGPDPFATHPVIGCVLLSGTAPSRADVGELVIALGESRRFVEPFISTTTTADSSEVTFSGSVGLSDRVYSRRYADPTKGGS
ncbi:hypothetical protein [Nocardioides sp. YIM 152315]|uniref:hypothetical protein n=1 Tax=Nocardioides sp. YIM 152315 TaxID=3031760 RepID=UPI0023DB42BC|nr:hypothetical protein [Nocardioides sp. YIM 152315]MDF1603488.1 hypothetical protein [Nocardioides sp. YIM 152315]